MRRKYALLKIAALISFLSFCLYPLTGGVKGEEATVAPYLFSAPSLLVFLLPRRFLSVARGIALGQSALICLAGGQALIIGLALRQPDKILELILAGFIVQLFFGLAAWLIDNPLKKAKSELAQIYLGAAATLIFMSLSYKRFQTNYTSMNPELIYRIIACSETYKASHGGLYADSLKSLTLAQGENCIYPFSIDGSSPYGKIRYSHVSVRTGGLRDIPLFWMGLHSGAVFRPTVLQTRQGYCTSHRIIKTPHQPTPYLPI